MLTWTLTFNMAILMQLFTKIVDSLILGVSAFVGSVFLVQGVWELAFVNLLVALYAGEVIVLRKQGNK